MAFALADACTKVNRKRLNELAARTGLHTPHLAPVREAVRDFGVKLLIVPHMTAPMTEVHNVSKRPFITIVADDTDHTVGLGQFDKMSLDRLIGMADGATVVATRQ